MIAGKDVVLVTLQALLLIALVACPPTWLLPGSPYPVYLAYVIIGLGLLTALLAVTQLKTALTPWPTPRPGGRLVTTGMYGWARHPIYGGLLLMALGVVLLKGSGLHLLLAGALFGLLYYKSVYEEQLLRQQYPEYAAYADHVRRF